MKHYATPTGIVIGSAWNPRPPQMSDDAILIQKALLKGTAMKRENVPFANSVHRQALTWLEASGMDRRQDNCMCRQHCNDSGAMSCACVQLQGMPAAPAVLLKQSVWQRVTAWARGLARGE